jgi:hypothetical protein
MNELDRKISVAPMMDWTDGAKTKHPNLRDPGPQGAICHRFPTRAIETGADYRLEH